MKRQHLRRRSDQLAARMAIYRTKRARYLSEHPACEVCLRVDREGDREACDGRSDDVHHMMGRGKHLLDESTWLATSRVCHDYIETHKRWARAVGLVQY